MIMYNYSSSQHISVATCSLDILQVFSNIYYETLTKSH